MKEDYLENLARAYNKELTGAEDPNKARVVGVVNEQIYLLSRLNYGRKIVGYIISTKECVKGLLTQKETPSRRVLPREGDINRIISLELELLTLLDSVEGEWVKKVLEYENRVLSLLCYLVK